MKDQEPQRNRKPDDRLSGNWKKNLKFLHVTFASWAFGSIMGVLAYQTLEGEKGELASGIYILIEYVFLWSLSLAIATGMIYSFFGGRGVIKSTWIIWKWIGSITVLFLYMFLMSPDAAAIAGAWDVYHKAAGIESESGFRLLVTTALVSVIFLFLYFISFKKPWGQRARDPISESPRIRKGTFIVAGGLLLYSGWMIYYFHSIRKQKISTYSWNGVPGYYEGTSNCAGSKYHVRIENRSDGKRSMSVESTHTTVYFEYAKAVKKRIEKSDTFPVNAVTGATTTSVCIMKAVENAVTRGDQPESDP